MGFPRTCVFLLVPGLVLGAFVLAADSAARDDVPAKTAKAKAGKSNSKQDPVQKYVRATDPSLYVGTETCKTCHEDMPAKHFYKDFEATPHFATTLDNKKGPEWHGCESCHGPG